MRNFYDRLIILFFIFSISSCANQIIPYLSIEDVKVEESVIKVYLSGNPNQNKCIEAFVFYKDDIQITGKFSFSEKAFYFYPVEKITGKHDYLVEISTELEDTEGHSLKNSFKYKYSTRTENIPPAIISVTPDNEAEINYTGITPEIVFSEPVDRLSFSQAFSITPSIPFLCIWADDNKSVEIAFEKEPSKNTIYSMVINTSLTDSQNNNLRSDYKSCFTYFPKTEHPLSYTILAIDDNERELDISSYNEITNKTYFKVNFTNEVSVDTISTYFSIYPDLQLSYTPNWETSKSITINLEETPEWNKPYTLTINEGFSDVFSQKMQKKKTYHLIFSKEKDRPVEFIKAFFLREENATSEDKFFPIDYTNVYSNLNIPVEYTGGQNVGQSEYVEKNLNLYCIFRISKEAQGLDIPSVLTGTKISPTNSCLSVVIDKCHFYTQAEYLSSPIGTFQFTQEDFSDWNLAVVCFDLTVQVFRADGLIRFSFSDSIKDNIGNTMKESLLFSYNKS